MMKARSYSILTPELPLQPHQARASRRAAFSFLAVGSLLLGACDAKASDAPAKPAEELLASDLSYREQAEGWTKSFSIDPWLANKPIIVRSIRTWRSATMLTKGMVCSTINGKDCYENATFQLEYEGERLLSMLETTNIFSGGAHGSTPMHDHLIDLAGNTNLRFGDLFNSWPKVMPLMQSAFCEGLKNRDRNYDCADIQEQAITLHAEPGLEVFAFVVHTQDYALGSFGDGQTTVMIEITPAIYQMIKPEYRADFERPLAS